MQKKAVRAGLSSTRSFHADVSGFCFSQKRKSNPSNPGEGDEWTIARDRGQRGITLDKLWLVRVLPTARNMWMAELEVQM